MSVDALSDVLRSVRLKGAVFFDVDADSPWAAEAPPAADVGPGILPGVDHVIEYHVVTSGECYATLLGEQPTSVHLTAGDVVAFPQGDPHVMSSEPGLRAEPDFVAHRAPNAPESLPIPMRIGDGDGPHTKLVCGFLGCDARPFNPLLSALPRMLLIRSNGDEEWIQRFIAFAQLESAQKRVGGVSMLAKLGEIMFIDVVRKHFEGLSLGEANWLAGLKDRQVGRALGLLHQSPGADWTLERLAKETGMSRTSLADRFVHFVGRPPMHYLTLWRMQLAAELLSDGDASLAQIAATIGYDSEAAFSRAFKRTVGLAPAQWRDKRTA